MKTSTIVMLVLGVVLMLTGMTCCTKYNTMVGKRENAKKQWKDVENQYQRRSDLIPNIVASVQGEATFEKSTLESVINARASATQVKIDPSNMTEGDMQKFQSAQGSLGSTLSRLMVVSEQYPQLQANGAFKDLRVTLEGTENRISNERSIYNDTSKEYNLFIQTFPNNFLSGMFGFNQMPYFEMEKEAKVNPRVSFDFK